MFLPKHIINFIHQQIIKDFEPFYIYDSAVIRTQCQNFQDISYADKSIHFATMANIHPQFLNIVRKANVNVFVNSLLHLNAVKEAGFNGEQIIFTASALPEKTMKEARRCGVQVNLDSPGQLSQWLSLFPGERAGIRCNIGDNVKPYSTRAGFFLGKESRLGFTTAEMEAIPDKSAIKGLHLYVGTDIFDIAYFMKCYSELVKLSEMFPNLEYLNFGGGFGVSEDGEMQFDVAAYGVGVSKLMEDVSRSRGKSLKLILEPGRIIGGEAGYFVCQVNDVKRRDNTNLIGVNASIVQFSRPLLYPDQARHPVAIIKNGSVAEKEQGINSIIYGCSTYSRDIFTRNVLLPEVVPCDIVVLGNAGSYSASSYTSFLGFPKPEEYFV